jgi:branched-subunit amino acid ABC-type transport system permease component
MVLGLIETVGSRLIGAQWDDYLLLAIVLLAFRFRPRGIFTTPVRTWD